MSFYIQLASPVTENCHGMVTEHIGDLFYSLSSQGLTEYFILFWNHLPVALEYFSHPMEDFLDMCLEIQNNLVDGSYYLSCSYNYFGSEWKMSWKDRQIVLDSKWWIVTGGDAMIEALNKKSRVEMSLAKFIVEWRVLCQYILMIIDKFEIDFLDVEYLQQMKNFCKLYPDEEPYLYGTKLPDELF